jgi:hypothetical protein
LPGIGSTALSAIFARFLAQLSLKTVFFLYRKLVCRIISTQVRTRQIKLPESIEF